MSRGLSLALVVGLVTGCGGGRQVAVDRVPVSMVANLRDGSTATTGAINGRVTYSRGADPLAGVTVVVSGNTSQTTITEDDGTYRVIDLTPGDYLVTFFFGDLEAHHRVRVSVNRTVTLFLSLHAACVQPTFTIDDGPSVIDLNSRTRSQRR